MKRLQRPLMAVQKTWLGKLQEHIEKCNYEIKFCISSESPLPPNISKEFESQWAPQTASFRKARNLIEKAMKGGDDQPEAFMRMVQKAESDLATVKDEFIKYKGFVKTYAKRREKHNLANAARHK